MGYFIECLVDPVILKRKDVKAKAGPLLELGYCSDVSGIKSAWDYINALMIFQNPTGKTFPLWVRNIYNRIGTDNPPLRLPRVYEPEEVNEWIKDATEVVTAKIGKTPKEISIANSSISVDKFIKEVSKNPTYNMKPTYFGDDPKGKYYEISDLGSPSFPPHLMAGDMFRIGSADMKIVKDKLKVSSLDDSSREVITNIVDID